MRAEDLSDEQLVASSLGGDLGAYDALIIRYKERLYGVVYHMTSNHEDANDLLMEVFDRAYRNLSSFKGNSSFYTWIYRIAMNRTINHLQKHKKRQKDISLNDMDFENGIQIDIVDPSTEVDPEKQAQLKELQIKLNESLQNLSDEHRAVVVLFDIQGLSHREIGQVMKCSEGTVRSRLHYAHKQLRRGLAGYIKGG